MLNPKHERLMKSLVDAAEGAVRSLNHLRTTVRECIGQTDDPEQLEHLWNLGARLDNLVNRQVVTGLSLEAAAKEIQRAARDGDAERLNALHVEFTSALAALPAEVEEAIREMNAIVDAVSGGGDANG